MSYSQFKTISEVCDRFDINIVELPSLFATISPLTVGERFKQLLEKNIPLANAINTEKARSELLIAPILLEIRQFFNEDVGFFSGSEFNVDVEKGLNGYCDFILTASREIYEIRRPVMTLVEAKNENIKSGLPQCMAEMIAAQTFNQKDDITLPVYGAVTTGMIWQFLRLTDKRMEIDLREYYARDLEKLLGVLSHPFETYFSDR